MKAEDIKKMRLLVPAIWAIRSQLCASLAVMKPSVQISAEMF
jgi:hypothetical protein